MEIVVDLTEYAKGLFTQRVEEWNARLDEYTAGVITQFQTFINSIGDYKGDPILLEAKVKIGLEKLIGELERAVGDFKNARLLSWNNLMRSLQKQLSFGPDFESWVVGKWKLEYSPADIEMLAKLIAYKISIRPLNKDLLDELQRLGFVLQSLVYADKATNKELINWWLEAQLHPIGGGSQTITLSVDEIKPVRRLYFFLELLNEKLSSVLNPLPRYLQKKLDKISLLVKKLEWLIVEGKVPFLFSLRRGLSPKPITEIRTPAPSKIHFAEVFNWYDEFNSITQSIKADLIALAIYKLQRWGFSTPDPEQLKSTIKDLFQITPANLEQTINQIAQLLKTDFETVALDLFQSNIKIPAEYSPFPFEQKAKTLRTYFPTIVSNSKVLTSLLTPDHLLYKTVASIASQIPNPIPISNLLGQTPPIAIPFVHFQPPEPITPTSKLFTILPKCFLIPSCRST